MEVEEKEFVALSSAAIHKLIEDRKRADRRESRRTRRRIARWPFPGPVQVWASNGHGEEEQVFGTCRNLNEQGIGFFCERAFEPGTTISVAIHQAEATYHGEGVVRHCTKSDREYFIGMEFANAD